MLTLKTGFIKPQDSDDFLEAAERGLEPLMDRMEYYHEQRGFLPDEFRAMYTWAPGEDEDGNPIMSGVSASVIYHDDELGKRPWWSYAVPIGGFAIAIGGIIDAIVTRSK